jgi:hypothetical protein
MKTGLRVIKRILLVGIMLGPVLGIPLHEANADYPCLDAPLSKLTAEKNISGADFQIKLINGCGKPNTYSKFSLTLNLGVENGPISSTSVEFNSTYQTDVKFHFSNEQLNDLSTINLRPSIQSGTQIINLGNFDFHFLCVEITNQKVTLDKNPLSQSAFLEVTIDDSCDWQYHKFIFSAVVEILDRKTYMQILGPYRDTIGIVGNVNGQDFAVTPILKISDKEGNSIVFPLKPFKANSLAWRKNLKTCAIGPKIKTQCDEFPAVSFELCSPLEDYKISEFDGNKWKGVAERFQAQKDLDRCKSSTPFYIQYGASNESLTKVNKVRFNFYATPTQKAQIWEIQIKTLKK